MVRSRFVSSFDNELAHMNVSWLKLGTPYDSGQGSVGRDDSLEDESRYMLDDSVQRSSEKALCARILI